jgi:hypothetical protein
VLQPREIIVLLMQLPIGVLPKSHGGIPSRAWAR